VFVLLLGGFSTLLGSSAHKKVMKLIPYSTDEN